MIEISNNINIKQVIEMTNNETGEVTYLIMNDEDKEWMKITKEDYNKIIRGNKNGK